MLWDLQHFVRDIMDKIDDDEAEDLPEYLEQDPGPIPTNLYCIGLSKSLWYDRFLCVFVCLLVCGRDITFNVCLLCGCLCLSVCRRVFVTGSPTAATTRRHKND